ncbi:nitrogen regulation protein NR(II) [Nitrospira sp. KM1]|uniref:two-component system sensor histidine kinase NtrB n=1 Tax=Nitrospira sp. KM1 TaxID=1936990 RepID=UPI0015666FE9|nr:ATP-binding protein [Nitrospira sp. KM1]
MFRPIPEAPFFRRAPFRLIASIPFVVAIGAIVIVLLSVEVFASLSRRDVIFMAVFLALSTAVSTAALISFLHFANTKRTLEEVKGLARNILQSIPTGILTVNRSGIVTAVNPTAEAVLKRHAADLLGNSYESVFPGGEIIREALHGALRNHQHMSQRDVPYEGPNGRLHTIRVSTVELVGDDRQPAGILLQAQDVTEWLGLEQRVRVAEKLAAIHTLSAGVAHELRNPLSAMDLNLHLLEQELREPAPVASRTAHYLEVLNAECRRLSAILDNFMRFARPSSVDTREVDVQQVIEHIVALMQLEAQEHKIRLDYTIEKDLPPVLGDETQIGQVLVNVVVNAFHAMADGGRCHLAATTCPADGKRWVDISVRDTGMGIPEEAMPRLFDPFYTTKQGGSGLGLAIAYRIMQDHGGLISVSSAPGSGTSVGLRFPALVTHPRTLEARS